MNTFETPGGVPNPVEQLKQQLSVLRAEADRLQKLIEESGENIDVELGSEAYIDHGYTASLREIIPEIEKIETQLKDIDDQKASQRNLAI